MLRGLLLDSGDTLMRPRGGRWNPRFDFEAVLHRHVPGYSTDRLVPALAKGDAYLRNWSTHQARNGYKAARADYHRTILAVLGVDPTVELLEDLDRPLPMTQVVEPFPDTQVGLARLRDDGWRMAIVADTSSRMVEVYKELALDRLIETFVISAELGCAKPDPRMYRTASDRLQLAAAECVFVDDSPDSLAGAAVLGYRVCGMARYGEPPSDGNPWVANLDDLRRHLYGLRQRSAGHDS